MNRFITLFLVLFVCSPLVAAAADDGLMFYSRMKLKLIPKPEPVVAPEPMPQPKPVPLEEKADSKKANGELTTTKEAEKEKDKKDELQVNRIRIQEPETPPGPPPREPIEFTVDMKPMSYFDQEDVISQTVIGNREGLLIAIDPPAVASISATRMLSSADVIFINEDGYITRIAPRLNIGELQEPVSSGKVVRAILYLKPGGVEQDRIVPGDHFENEIFKTYPVIVQ